MGLGASTNCEIYLILESVHYIFIFFRDQLSLNIIVHCKVKDMELDKFLGVAWLELINDSKWYI